MDLNQRNRIEELYIEMFDKMVIYARINLGSDTLAEEAVQETFRIACQKPKELCDSPNPQGWLVLTLRNTIRNMKSSRATAQRIIETYVMMLNKERTFAIDHIDPQVLYGNLADSDEFKLLTELAIEGRSHEEMAYSRNISINACKKRVQRAKALLRKKIGK